MNTSSLATLYRYELRMLLRDRRTILVSILLPIVVMPIFLIAPRWIERARKERQQERTYKYAVVGTEAALARELIASWEPPAPAGDDAQGNPPLKLVEIPLAEVKADPAADPQAALASGLEAKELSFFIEAFSAEEAARVAEEEEKAEDGAAPAPRLAAAEEDERLPLPVLRLVYRESWETSITARREMEKRLHRAQAKRRWALLRDRGLELEADQVAPVDGVDVATASQVSGAALGRWATVFLMMFMFVGGSVVAADTIAGEKERGTLETLLTTAANRTEIVTAKLCVVVTVGVFIGLVQVLNLLAYLRFELIPLPDNFAIEINFLSAIVLLLLLVPLAVLIGGVLLLVSGRSKTYKEFQILFLPVFLLGLVPAMASLLPGLKLRSAIVAVPVANISVAVREVLTGELDFLMLPIAWLVTSAAAVVTLRATLKTLSTERLITAAEVDSSELFGGPSLFPRRVVRWFALMWAAIFAVSLNFPEMSLRSQVILNVLLVILGGSIAMVRTYRLDPKEAMALRPVRSGVWLAVILGAPAALFFALAIAKLSGLIFPLPERFFEQLGQTFSPPGMPLWELLIWIAVVPGICEEIGFRGLLLHGLRKRFHPVVLCLVVGLVFGLFHFQLFRLLQTAFLGILLSALTLLTGSIYPAMLWHALNNTTAVLIGHFGVSPADLPVAVYVASFVIVILSLTWLWRQRTAYPDLRSSAKS